MKLPSAADKANKFQAINADEYLRVIEYILLVEPIDTAESSESGNA